MLSWIVRLLAEALSAMTRCLTASFSLYYLFSLIGVEHIH